MGFAVTTPHDDLAKRRQAILDCFREHGGTRTAEQFRISRARVYQIIDAIRYGGNARRRKQLLLRKRALRQRFNKK